MRDGRPTTRPLHARVLLLQARRLDDPTREHELACFAEKLGVASEDLTSHTLLDGVPTLETVLSHDALVIGGSGEFYVSRRNLPGFDALLDLLGEVVVRGHPTFGSCFGYQCLVELLGGQVVFDPAATEVGTFDLELTPEGAHDPLLGALPRRFQAQQGHRDRAASHPAGLPNLARSALSPLQALRVDEQPIWGTQFHPELCARTNRERFEYYRENYAEDVPAEAARFAPSDEASSLLRRFVELVIG